MTTPEQFDGWLERELSKVLPAEGPIPSLRFARPPAKGWARLVGWLIPPISGKLLVATTAVALAGTAGAVAARGHVTIPPLAPQVQIAPVEQSPSPPPAGTSAAGATSGQRGATPAAGREPGEGTTAGAPASQDGSPARSRETETPGSGTMPRPAASPEAPGTEPSAQPTESPEPRQTASPSPTGH